MAVPRPTCELIYGEFFDGRGRYDSALRRRQGLIQICKRK